MSLSVQRLTIRGGEWLRYFDKVAKLSAAAYLSR